MSKQETKIGIIEWVRLNIPVKATPRNSFVTRRVRTEEKPLKRIRLISDYFENLKRKLREKGSTQNRQG